MSNLPETTAEQASEAARARSRETQPAHRIKLRDLPPLIKETDLAPKHRLLVEYMVHGPDKPYIAGRITRPVPIIDPETNLAIGSQDVPVPQGQPLTLEEAADLIGMRRRTARILSKQPAFQRLLAKETAAFREGAKARHWRNIDRIGMDPGAGKAADRKVQLQASALLTGETGERSGTSVNVNVGIQHITPGYVIDLREPDQPDTATTIEGTTNQTAGRNE